VEVIVAAVVAAVVVVLVVEVAVAVAAVAVEVEEEDRRRQGFTGIVYYVILPMNFHKNEAVSSRKQPRLYTGNRTF
jgi:hypothetical protein